MRNSAFGAWLRRQFYLNHNRLPSSQAVQDVIDNLTAKALFESPPCSIHIRIASHESAIYIDLCNDTWQAVQITGEGWDIVDSQDVPVKFRRTRGMKALPVPEKGGNLNELKSFVNIADEDFVLVKAWLIATCRPDIPFAILTLNGQQGSAKSKTERILRELIDPNECALRAKPRDERDLAIMATNSWIIAFDNLSVMPDWLSDAFCRLSTGGGFSTRQLHTDDDEKLFTAKRPLMLNGIGDFLTKSDLLSRNILVSTPFIPEHARRDEAEFYAEFEKAKPRLFGALLDAVSFGLRNLSTVELSQKSRMADFEKFGAAVLGKEFIERYQNNREEINQLALEFSTIAPLIQKFMEQRNEWTGKATELLNELESLSDERTKNGKDFPKNSKALSQRLNLIAPNLRETGIEVNTKDRTSKERRIRLEKIGKLTSSASSASLISENGKMGNDANHNEMTQPTHNGKLASSEQTNKNGFNVANDANDRKTPNLSNWNLFPISLGKSVETSCGDDLPIICAECCKEAATCDCDVPY